MIEQCQCTDAYFPPSKSSAFNYVDVPICSYNNLTQGGQASISDLIAGMWSAEIEPHSLEQTQLNSAPAEAAIWNFKSVIKISPLRKYWLFYLLDTSFTRLYTWYNYLACNCKHTDKFPILDFILFQAFWKKICTPTVSDSDVSYSLCQHMERPIFMSMLDIKIIAVFLLF